VGFDEFGSFIVTVTVVV
jgi:hypothetical protein